MVHEWLGMEQFVERKISFFLCVASLPPLCFIPLLLRGMFVDGSLFGLTVDSRVFGPFLDATPCFITYPPVMNIHIDGCYREMAVEIPPTLSNECLPLSKNI